ncbi:ATP-binding cassette domain-containing protein [Ferrimonas futtsuensis]|uniref:ATP-binding cassette domain-containing protein n=1 Tax=Ferrimonas futtsuensis TaxID=364764 RepID=UPI0004888CB5|nr:excinuclease ABC subunit UvrA [Ferrimonas futtsuensis]
MRAINIINAHHNNLKSVDIAIPRNRIVCFAGVSGSGKSSLVFDTIQAEAQRQLYATLGTYAQNHLPTIPKPDCDLIENLSPAVVIRQQRSRSNGRSTVGTVSEIAAFLRLLFSRLGTPQLGASNHFSFNKPEGMCPCCGGSGQLMELDVDKVFDRSRSLNQGAILFPEFKVDGWQWKYIAYSGFFDRDRPLHQYDETLWHRLLYGIEENVSLDGGDLGLTITYEGVLRKIQRLYIHKDQDSLSSRKKQAVAPFLSVQTCHSCQGARLKAEALSVTLNRANIHTVSQMQLDTLSAYLDGIQAPQADTLLAQIRNKVRHLVEIGLGYLSLSRPIATLSGGEAQRLKLANQLGSSLTEILYILDEPSVGLHPKDVHQLNRLLAQLKDQGNSVLVVEHDPDVLAIAEHVIEVGPKAGTQGGNIVFQGSYAQLLEADTLTSRALNAPLSVKKAPRKPMGHLPIREANSHNLKNVSVDLPTSVLCCLTGVAGSGKSSLIHHEFLKRYPDAIVVDQSAVGQSQRSNTATYTGLFDEIRKQYGKANMVKPSLFSFNSEGACPECKGLGFVEMEMAFLEPVRTQCKACKGSRYAESTLQYRLAGLNIAQLLALTVDQAAELLTAPKLAKHLTVLQQVGLGYLTLGQPLSTLSGGECQRIKLSSELHKSGQVYVLDEPTTGLHLSDIARVMAILERLVAQGNSVYVIEHDLDVIAQADWVIDLGPHGGEQGGQIVFEGTPGALLQAEHSHTGRYLAKYLARRNSA